MKCDIIIPVWNQLEFTKSCIEHVVENTLYPYKLILIDNGSGPETRKYLEELRGAKKIDVELIRNEENLGFVKAANQGLKVSNGAYVCLLNNDTLPGVGWLTELVEFARKHKDAGLLNPLCSGHIALNLSINEYAKELSVSNRGKFMEMNQCQGFSMLIKREVIDKIGNLDERFGMGGFDDTDYSMRAHMAGYKSVCVHSSYVFHREHKSFDKLGDRKKLQKEAERRYFSEWPRHLRMAMIISVSKDTDGRTVANFLDLALFMAKEWCWANLFIFGDRFTKDRVNAIKKKMCFPVHQNIKFNYLNKRFKILEIAVRILERSFGRKSRKKYDGVICNEIKFTSFLKFLCNIQKCAFFRLDFGSENGILTMEKFLRKVRGPMPLVDIILPVCDQYRVTKKCIESILENTDSPYRLIIVNNGKNPDTRKFLEELAENEDVETEIIHNDRNLGWVKALNQGIDASRAPYVCFQNNDTVVTRGWLRKMINILDLEEDFGMINPTWEGKPANLSIDRYNSMLERNKGSFVRTDWCRGFSVVIKKAVIEKVGHVDEIYNPGYLDDVDYSVRAIEAGYLTLRSLDTYIYHERNVTSLEVLGEKWVELFERNKRIYHKKWGKPLKVVIILNNKVCRSKAELDGIEDTVFYLTQRQHHIDIWSPRNFTDRFKHTNVRLKVYISPLLRFSAFLDLYLNTKRKDEKRYSVVFSYDSKFGKFISGNKLLIGLTIYKSAKDKDFDTFIKETVDTMKAKTKEFIHVEL